MRTHNLRRLIDKRISKRFQSEEGLTLVEIIVVLIILATLMAFLGGKIFGVTDQANVDLTKLKMKELKSTINQFQLRYNQLPNTLDTLISGTSEIGAGFVPLTNEDGLRDAWGTPFQYQSDGRRYVIKSLGADRLEGGEGKNFDITEEGP